MKRVNVLFVVSASLICAAGCSGSTTTMPAARFMANGAPQPGALQGGVAQHGAIQHIVIMMQENRTSTTSSSSSDIIRQIIEHDGGVPE